MGRSPTTHPPFEPGNFHAVRTGVGSQRLVARRTADTAAEMLEFFASNDTRPDITRVLRAMAEDSTDQ